MDKMYKGIVGAKGVSICKALVIKKEEIVVKTNLISENEIENEVKIFNDNILLASQEINELIEKTKKTMGESKSQIFEAHLDLLNDPSLIDLVVSKIMQDKKNVELALNEAVNEISQMFLSLDDDYLKERVADFKDVTTRLMQKIKGIKNTELDNLQEDCILVGEDFTPSDTGKMDINKVKGIVTDAGGKTAHIVIIAKSLEITTIVGMGDFSSKINNGDLLILDGYNGVIYVNPNENLINEYSNKIKVLENKKIQLDEIKNLPCETIDKTTVELAINIGSPKDIKDDYVQFIDGVGLFRTEFLYMENDHFPTEEKQFEVYKQAASKLKGKKLIIRTLDIGGDKELSYFDFDKELNPFMGYRAIRICLTKKDVFITQLRAILRASSYGTVCIMFPMIISSTELIEAKKILEQSKKQLDNENVEYDKNIKVGIMIETPASVVMSDQLAKHCDFFSIGTNDLTGYTLAVDRGNEKIAHMYNSFNPAVVHSIKKVIDSSHNNNIWTGMCGEFASDKRAVLMLLGFGLDEFSMSSSAVLEVKNLIRKVKISNMKKIADHVLTLNSADEIESYLDNLLAQLENL